MNSPQNPPVPALLLVGDRLKARMPLSEVERHLEAVAVVYAASGAAALQIAGQTDIFMVLVADALPDMDGCELVQSLQAGGGLGALPVFIVSEAARNAAYLSKVYASGACDYLCAGIAPELFWAKLRAQVKLAASNARLKCELAEVEAREQCVRDTLYHSSLGVIEMSLEGAILEVSPHLCALLGYKQEELLQKTIWDLSHPDDLERSRESFQQLIRVGSGETYSMETCYRTSPSNEEPREEYHWVRVTLALQASARGEPLYYIALIQDIAKEKSLVEKLVSQQDIFEVAATAARFGVWELSHKTGKVFHSKIWKDLLDYDEEEIGDSFDDFRKRIHPEDSERVLTTIKAAQTNPQCIDMEYRLRKKDGSYRWVRAITDFELDGQGQVLRTYGGILDIHETKVLEMELRQAKAEADTANRAKSDFLSNISHELRTPLNPILGFSGMMLKGEVNPNEIIETGTIIHDAGRHMLELVEDILDFEKIEAGHLKLDRQWIDFEECVHQAVDLLTPEARKKQLEVKFENAVDSQLQLRMDPLILRQMCFNLIGNAIKFSDAGLIMICTRLESGVGQVPTFVLSVIDQGIGIAKKDCGRILEPFEQGDARATREYGGSGLGLSITSLQTKALGGRLELESTPGEGSIFTVSFPVEVRPTRFVPGDSCQLGLPTKVVDQAIGLDSSILLVDDNEGNQKLAEVLLQRMGFEVVTASSGEDAIRQVKNKAFSLILMDLKMPKMDGFTATQRIQAAYPGGCPSKIIAFTANASKDVEVKCRAMGMVGLLRKPIQTDDFRSYITEQLTH